jgi:hypothetical protein
MDKDQETPSLSLLRQEDHEFAGRVQRPFVTAMYTGRRR